MILWHFYPLFWKSFLNFIIDIVAILIAQVKKDSPIWDT